MRLAALEVFACPDCGTSLRLVRADKAEERNGRIQEGQLGCTNCPATFPIVRSMPRFVATEAYAASFGYQWNRYAKLQLDSFSGQSLSRDRFYATTRWPPRMEGQCILEAGCGMGRFTEIVLRTGAEIFSFDLSAAIEANFINNGAAGSLHVFQADIYRIPLRKEAFDKVFCMGVLQHCPDVKRAFLSLVPFLRSGGEIVIDVYQRYKLVPPLKYWVRPFVRWMRPESIHRLLRLTIPPLFDLKKALYKIPAVGKPLGDLIPIGPLWHKPGRKYTEEELKEIKILSALDMLSPAHDHPQRMKDVKLWLEEAGLVGIQVETGFNGITARGRKP